MLHKGNNYKFHENFAIFWRCLHIQFNQFNVINYDFTNPLLQISFEHILLNLIVNMRVFEVVDWLQIWNQSFKKLEGRSNMMGKLKNLTMIYITKILYSWIFQTFDFKSAVKIWKFKIADPTLKKFLLLNKKASYLIKNFLYKYTYIIIYRICLHICLFSHK